MELQELLGISPGVTALIGGGGKTTMMYALARERTTCRSWSAWTGRGWREPAASARAVPQPRAS